MLKRLRTFVKPGPRAAPLALGSVTGRVDDAPGWSSISGRPHEYDPGQARQLYADALEAWRKNPIAWRVIAITTDYVIGDQISISSPQRGLAKFIHAFWAHPQNRMALRLEAMCDELSRSGDLFVALFRNPQDGMSYIRFVTKDRIERIETAANDWETELAYYETRADNPAGEPRKWLSPAGLAALQGASTGGGQDLTRPRDRSATLSIPQGWGGAEPGVCASPSPSSILHSMERGPGGEAVGEADAVMLHYSVNRPLGALLGESDLTTMLPWLLRYSRMLEDRVRLHAATRAFLWDVTVPANTVQAKREQYRTPPEAGSILIHDPSETWQAVTPRLEGADARSDLQAVRALLDAGSGFPPHWRGDAGDISLATAQAMQAPTERHLARRQRFFTYMLQDILYHAYQRAAQIGMAPRLRSGGAAGGGASGGGASGGGGADGDYEALFRIAMPDISRWDNESLARAARDLSQAYDSLGGQLATLPPTLAQHVLRTLFKFSGEPQSEETIARILAEAQHDG